MNDQDLGRSGENRAAEHLIERGHVIISRNFKWNRGELDIVSLKDGLLIITEVKTRSYNGVVEPYKSVNNKKQKQIIRVSNAFIEKYRREEEVRFDVISIIISEKGLKLNHIESAFYPTM
jgi:putative endonuclease